MSGPAQSSLFHCTASQKFQLITSKSSRRIVFRDFQPSHGQLIDVGESILNSFAENRPMTNRPIAGAPIDAAPTPAKGV